jgi:hypothetical protein
MPISDSQSTATPRPIASATCDVPASNFHGSSIQVDESRSTRLIMWPPPMKGGISSSRPTRPCSTPMPVGP